MKQQFIERIIARPRPFIALAVLLSLTLASGIFFLHIEDDLMKMLPEDIPSRQVWNEIEVQFGSTEPLLLSIGHSGESIYNRKTLAKVWDLTRQLEALPFVDEVQSLATMQRMDSDDGFLVVGDLMPARDLTDEKIGKISDYLTRNPDLAGMVLAPEEDYTMLAIITLPGTADKEIATTIQDLTRNPGGYDQHIGGLPYVRGIVAKIVRGEILNLLWIAALILAFVLLTNLRSVFGLVMVMVVTGLSTGSMLGFFGWLYYLTRSELFYFTMVNASMPVILLTIATADGVHIMTRFFREVRQHRDVKTAVANTMDVLMLPVFLTSVTTMAGFLALTSAPLKAMVGYGITVCFGIAWAWFLSVTFLPALMTVKKWNLESRALKSAGLLEKVIRRTGQFVLRRPKTIVISGVTGILVVAIGITLIRIEVNIISFFKPTSPIAQSLQFVDDHFYGSANLVIRAEGDLKEPGALQAVEDIQNLLDQEKAVGHSVSIANIIKKLHRVVMDDSVQYEVIPDTRSKVSNLLTLYSMSGDPDDFSRLVDYGYRTGLITTTFKMSSTEELVAMVRRIEENLVAREQEEIDVQLSGMPVFFRDFMQALIKSSLRSIGIALIMVAILSWIFFKSLRWGLIAVIPLASAVLLNFGLMGWIGIEMSHVTALFASIIIGVGVDYAVHFIAQCKHFLGRGIPRDQVIQTAIEDVGYPIVLNMAAVSVGFSALLFSDFVPIKYMGGLVILSMVSCAVGTLTLMAAIIHLARNKVSA